MFLRQIPRSCLVFAAIVSSTIIFATGCAAVAIEATEAGALEVGATESAAMAPEASEAAVGANATGGDEIVSKLTSSDAPSELRLVRDGGGFGTFINGNQKFGVDWSQGLIRDTSGKSIASIEGNFIYTNGPQGRTLVAEILDTRTLQPSALYSAATAESTIVRFLRTGESVQIISVSNGWYQLRTVDGSNGWMFAPLLLSQVNRQAGNKEEHILYETRPSERDLVDSTVLAAARIHGDIQHFMSRGNDHE
jgi:hypothetical protein